MKKSELTLLREQVRNELSRRKQINQLLENQDVLRYVKLIGQSTDKIELNNIREILIRILQNFEVKDTNGIYVCTKAYDCDSQAPIIYYSRPGNKGGHEHKCYVDIESKKEVKTDWIYGPSINSFEKSHIVLNPYNASYNDENIKENGYEDVRLDFFEECYKNGQNKAIQKILKKYPRIGSNE